MHVSAVLTFIFEKFQTMIKTLKSAVLGSALALGLAFSMSAQALVVVGPNAGVGDTATSSATVAASAGTVSFSWIYHTNDGDGPSFDVAGYFLGLAFPQFSDNNGANDQSGSGSFAVLANDSYGFFVTSTDGIGGNAILTINDLVFTPRVVDPNPNQVPEPGSLALLGLGLLAMAAARKRNLL